MWLKLVDKWYRRILKWCLSLLHPFIVFGENENVFGLGCIYALWEWMIKCWIFMHATACYYNIELYSKKPFTYTHHSLLFIFTISLTAFLSLQIWAGGGCWRLLWCNIPIRLECVHALFSCKKNEYIHTWVSAIVIPKELREKNDVHEIGRDFSTWLFCTFSFQTSRPLFLIFWVCYCTDGYEFLPSQEMQSERKEKEWIWREKGKVKRKNA